MALILDARDAREVREPWEPTDIRSRSSSGVASPDACFICALNLSNSVWEASNSLALLISSLRWDPRCDASTRDIPPGGEGPLLALAKSVKLRFNWLFVNLGLIVSATTALGRTTGVRGLGRDGAAYGAGDAPGSSVATSLFLVPPSIRIVSGCEDGTTASAASSGYLREPVISRLTRDGNDLRRWSEGREICSSCWAARSSSAAAAAAAAAAAEPRSPAETPGVTVRGAPISDPIPESSLFAPYCENLSC